MVHSSPTLAGVRVAHGRDGTTFQLLPAAVDPAGRRSRNQPSVDDAIAAAVRIRADGVSVVVVLDHAGPRAALWSPERAWGPAAIAEVDSGRTPRALDDDGWQRVCAHYVQAAHACQAQGVRACLGLDDDGLLHATLSPLTHPASLEERMRWPLAIARAVAAHDVVDAALVVEDLCPRGLDATDGIAIARALVTCGFERLVTSSGCTRLPALKVRHKGQSDARGHVAFASSRWLVGRVEAELWAGARGVVDVTADFADLARALGVQGVVVDAQP
jgi:2,4-dienoyl-CoA reductase-like NADH-dependent reductase (Old Yellow Enzyme family)